MTQYPNYYQNQSMCNPENCKRCYKKYGCSKYVSYLESIASSPVPVSSPTLSSPLTMSQMQTEFQESEQFAVPQSISTTTPVATIADIDLTPLIESNNSLKDSIVDIVVNKFLVLQGEYKTLKEVNDNVVNKLSETKEAIDRINDKFGSLDKLIVMIDAHEAQNNQNNQNEGENQEGSSLAVYTGEPISEKILVEKKSKGFFGIGAKTEWVEEDKTKNK